MSGATRNPGGRLEQARISLLAVLTHDRTLFWAAGLLIGLFSGPNQAASRSLMGRFVPPNKENEFYGLFAFSGKATAYVCTNYECEFPTNDVEKMLELLKSGGKKE